jgi:hypothetical protein
MKIIPSSSEPSHGTRTGYVRRRCRCEKCREWQRDYVVKTPPTHGTRYSYIHHHCRCEACREANAAHTREFYSKNSAILCKRTRAYAAKNPDKAHAWAVVNREKMAGSLKPLPCEECGSTKDVVAHHPDYEKPLEVRWLCRVHHYEVHKSSIAVSP